MSTVTGRRRPPSRPPGSPRVPGSGRKKGTPNKSTAEVKRALEVAFVKLGGITSLVEWGRREPTEFYKLWGRLLPTQVNVGNPDGTPLVDGAELARMAALIAGGSPGGSE